MRDARFDEIKKLCEEFDALGDEAFVDKLAEHSVSRRDLKDYARERENRERTIRNARRVR